MFFVLSPTAAHQVLCVHPPRRKNVTDFCVVQLKWESMQSNSYSIKEDNTEQLEGSGTRIVLHLKEDSEEYLDDFKVQQSSAVCSCDSAKAFSQNALVSEKQPFERPVRCGYYCRISCGISSYITAVILSREGSQDQPVPFRHAIIYIPYLLSILFTPTYHLFYCNVKRVMLLSTRGFNLNLPMYIQVTVFFCFFLHRSRS